MLEESVCTVRDYSHNHNHNEVSNFLLRCVFDPYNYKNTDQKKFERISGRPADVHGPARDLLSLKPRSAHRLVQKSTHRQARVIAALRQQHPPDISKRNLSTSWEGVARTDVLGCLNSTTLIQNRMWRKEWEVYGFIRQVAQPSLVYRQRCP